MAKGETTFGELGVSAEVVAALSKKGITSAFPIQAETIEAALAGRDICGKAPTGSGKTLAFGIPVVDLVEKGKKHRPRALILSPTRELAIQIKTELAPLAKARGRSVLTVYGGTDIQKDRRALVDGVDIVVATPGRLEDLISREYLSLHEVDLVVVDEADRMADMGFLHTVKRILDQTSDDRRTLLFSATLDGDVDELIIRYQNDPLTVEVESVEGESGDVTHLWYRVNGKGRIDLTARVLERYESAIVFCRTRKGCDRAAQLLVRRGVDAVAIHGDRSQAQRERALGAFKRGTANVLVATDVAARGIHVDNVSLVLHYDPPEHDKDYIHRSGRTGRAGAAGTVMSFIIPQKIGAAKSMQKKLFFPVEFDEFSFDNLPQPVTRIRRERKKSEGGERKETQGLPKGGKSARFDSEGRSEDGPKRTGPKGKGRGRDRRPRYDDDNDGVDVTPKAVRKQRKKQWESDNVVKGPRGRIMRDADGNPIRKDDPGVKRSATDAKRSFAEKRDRADKTEKPRTAGKAVARPKRTKPKKRWNEESEQKRSQKDKGKRRSPSGDGTGRDAQANKAKKKAGGPKMSKKSGPSKSGPSSSVTPKSIRRDGR